MSDPPGVFCRKCFGRGYLNLRGDAGDARFRNAVAKVAGVELPVEPCTWNAAASAGAYWLGPDEWLLAVENGLPGAPRSRADASQRLCGTASGPVAPTSRGTNAPVRVCSVGGVERKLRDALADRFSVADVTGAQFLVELSGPDAGKVLQKSSPYDFHPRNFRPGRCVQTVFAQATALVAARDGGAFEIVFRRSYADYLLRWIADAAAEYGYRVG